jgi:hypothetical protein
MPLSADRWKGVSPSQFAWEREALDFIRARLPDCEPYRAWTNFEFVADGRKLWPRWRSRWYSPIRIKNGFDDKQAMSTLRSNLLLNNR